MPIPGQIQVTHVDNADTASTVIAAASAAQRCYVLGLYYRNGSAGALNPVMNSNANKMWGGASVGAGGSAYFAISSEGLPMSDGVNNSLTFGSSASVTSDLTVWWFYGY